MGNVKIFFFTLLLTACGQRLPQILEVRDIDLAQKPCRSQFNGELPLVDGTTLSLNNLQKNTLMIFASESCISCTEEITRLRNYFSEKGSLPKNAEIISVLLGAIAEDTKDWINNLKIPWTVGYDFELELYKSYFGQLKTPSILISNKASNSVKCFQEVKNIQDLEKEMGGWEF